jgi:hypothetical protein
MFVADMFRILSALVHHMPDAEFPVEVRLERFVFTTAVLFRVWFAENIVQWDCKGGFTARTLNPDPLLKVRGPSVWVINYLSSVGEFSPLGDPDYEFG